MGTRCAASLVLATAIVAAAIASTDSPADGASPGAAGVRADVEALLARQAEAWSRGDLESFCGVYAEDAIFVSPTGLTRGRRAVLERYRERYPDAAAMGRLTLDVLDVHPSPEAGVAAAGPGGITSVSVVARWTLAYPDKPKLEGLTLLVLDRTPAGWLIVRDASM